MASILEIRACIPYDIFDHQQLVGLLKGYVKVRDRIGRFLRNGDIVRIRKGLYTFAEPLRRNPISLPLLANLIYGPSYVSGAYALSHYGLIPERVSTITSETTGRSCLFETPFGRFSYRRSLGKRYPIGVTRVEAGTNAWLLATPEKAIFDYVQEDARFKGGTQDETLQYLTEDLRVELDALQTLNPLRINELSRIARGRMRDITDCLSALVGNKQ